MDNPFEILNNRLINIEKLLLDVKHSRIQNGEPIVFEDFVRDSNLSFRCKSSLYRIKDDHKIETLGQFLKINPMELLKTRNFGRKSLTEIINYLNLIGVSFYNEKLS